jgi:serine/threonine protein phosphatase PrpC
MSDDAQADTNPDLAALPAGAAAPAAFDVDVGGRTHPGRVRPNNEDNFHVVRFGRYLRTVLSSLPARDVPGDVTPPGYGFAVADGIGGREAGEVASRAAITLLVEAVLQTPDWILGWEDESLGAVMERTDRRFRQVGEAVRDRARGRPDLRGMGTTLSLALSLSDALIVAHVGDSPAFLFRDGRLLRLTRDHTIGQELGDRGSAAAHFRHVLTRCIGGSGPVGQPDVARYRLADGDRLLLCTDGLTDMVDDESIARELGRGSPSDEACRALVELALDRGGRDNVTVVVASYRRP